jgi:hypothetical protein
VPTDEHRARRHRFCTRRGANARPKPPPPKIRLPRKGTSERALYDEGQAAMQQISNGLAASFTQPHWKSER